ncbi:MAG: exosortase/archaeosortase family protein [Nanoarchaeota archaeon]
MKIKKYMIYFLSSSILALCLVVFIYNTTFIWLYERYTAVDSYYSHGFLIPFVSLLLIWLKRNEFKDYLFKSDRFGLILIIIALTMHVVSILAEVFFLSAFSLLILVFGFCFLFFGKNFTKKIYFPLIFLIFMLPLPFLLINSISFPLKMFVTKSAVFLIKVVFGIPIKNEGFQIFFPKATLLVENPCSGLRSLISMLALGSIFSYLIKKNSLKKYFLFLLSVLIALFSNLIRVIMLCLAVYIYGSKMSSGFFHDFSGYLAFAIAFITLWISWRKLNV